jgi:hypothetical protein
MVMMVGMMVAMLRGGEGRAGKHHQKQCRSKNFLHAKNVT